MCSSHHEEKVIFIVTSIHAKIVIEQVMTVRQITKKYSHDTIVVVLGSTEMPQGTSITATFQPQSLRYLQ